jgi:phosphonate transport system substrate-binding protein
LLGFATAASILPADCLRADARPFRFGLTPVFLTSDLALLEGLQSYLENAMDMKVQLVLRRTYQEITAELISGQLDAAWICGFPYVVNRARMALVATPLWRRKSVYQSYLIAATERRASSIDDLAGDIHAFSDPDSNSGYLVSRALLAERGRSPAAHFARNFFTYGHRNVVRAVAAGLAQSGSVDGYVWEVMTETEPELAQKTKVVWRSEWMGFPPIATATGNATNTGIQRFADALRRMDRHETGRKVLGLLRLDGFADADAAGFDAIAARVELVRRAG